MTKINLEYFDTSEILNAVDQFDRLQGILAHGDMRGDLMNLHELAMHAAADTDRDATELVDQAIDVEDQLHQLSEATENILNVIMKITDGISDIDDDLDDD